MSFDAMKEHYSQVIVCGIPALLSYARIDRYSVPSGVYQYEVRHCDDDPFTPAQVATGIWVNHYGTLLTKDPLPLPSNEYLDIDAEKEWAEMDACSITLKEFVKPATQKHKAKQHEQSR